MPIYLDRRIAAGDPVDREDLIDAESTAKTLRAISDLGLDSRITEEVVTTAELRAFAVRYAHANAQFPLGPSRPESTNIDLNNVAQLDNALNQTRQLLDQTQ